MIALKVEKRSMSTKAKRLRREGFATGSTFGREIPESIPVRMERIVAERLFKTCNKGSRILSDMNGQVFNVLIRDICFNSMKGLIEGINLQAFVSSEKVRSVTEIILLNHDKTIGGVLQQRIQEISHRTLPGTTIDKAKIDVGGMKVSDIIRVGGLDIARNENIEPIIDLDTIAATVITAYTATETADEAAPEIKQTGDALQLSAIKK